MPSISSTIPGGGFYLKSLKTMSSDEVDQDNNDLHGGFKWANMWQTIFFVLQIIVMLFSLALNLCLIKSMARNSSKEASVIYLTLIFFFFTSLVDSGLIMENFMSIYGLQSHSTGKNFHKYIKVVIEISFSPDFSGIRFFAPSYRVLINTFIRKYYL